MPSTPNILVVKLSAIGDVILTTPAVRALRRHLPEARISWIVEPKAAGVLEGNPDIDEIIVYQRKLAKSLPEFLAIRKRKFDIALDFQGLARSALVTLASGARRRIGYAGGREHSSLGYNELFDCPEKPHGLRCHLGMLNTIGVRCDDEDGAMRLVGSREEFDKVEDALASIGVGRGEPIVAFVVAASKDGRNWRKDGWAEVADRLWDELGLRAVFLGAKADQTLIGNIMSHVKSAPVVSLAGMLPIKLSSVVLARSRFVVAVDTGLMHAAAAYGTNTVAIFGPTSAYRNHMHLANFRMVRKELDCVPCDKAQSCQTRECILQVTAEDVMAAVRSFAPDRVLEGSAG